jgi:hypothetical protein
MLSTMLICGIAAAAALLLTRISKHVRAACACMADLSHAPSALCLGICHLFCEVVQVEHVAEATGNLQKQPRKQAASETTGTKLQPLLVHILSSTCALWMMNTRHGIVVCFAGATAKPFNGTDLCNYCILQLVSDLHDTIESMS